MFLRDLNSKFCIATRNIFDLLSNSKNTQKKGTASTPMSPQKICHHQSILLMMFAMIIELIRFNVKWNVTGIVAEFSIHTAAGG